MAQFAVLIYHHDSAHAPDSTSEDREVCDSHSDELSGTGVMAAAYALTPRNLAVSLRGDATTSGPYVDSEHIVVGFYIIDAPGLDEAIAIARTNPSVWDGGAVEVRPIHSSFLRGGPAPQEALPA